MKMIIAEQNLMFWDGIESSYDIEGMEDVKMECNKGCFFLITLPCWL